MQAHTSVHVEREEKRVLAAHFAGETLQLARLMSTPGGLVAPEEIP
jgi:hypothetical protein